VAGPSSHRAFGLITAGGMTNGMTVSASVVHVWPRLVNAAALVTVLVDGTSLGMPVPARTGLEPITPDGVPCSPA
jgi:hypothetical protein